MAEIRATNLIAKAARAAELTPELIYLQHRLLRVQKTTLLTQKASLRVQRRTFALLGTSLDIQRRTLAAAESIDRKTGGRFPPATAASP
jgi:hypothetical protein